jgi:hypothetical protein
VSHLEQFYGEAVKITFPQWKYLLRIKVLQRTCKLKSMRFEHDHVVSQTTWTIGTSCWWYKALCYKPEGRGFDSRLGEFLN